MDTGGVALDTRGVYTGGVGLAANLDLYSQAGGYYWSSTGQGRIQGVLALQLI